ncbi:MAG TPA: hypothetical protein VGD46_19455 [Rhizobacter sp.]
MNDRWFVHGSEPGLIIQLVLHEKVIQPDGNWYVVWAENRYYADGTPPWIGAAKLVPKQVHSLLAQGQWLQLREAPDLEGWHG